MLSRLILLAIVILFVVHCLSLNFIQDDALISCRYAQNLMQGNGLVFNAGERVEGYTNFLWIILLSLFARLGLDMITVSKILGIVSGCVTLILLYQISRLFFPKRDWLFSLFPSLLLTATGAFAYWSTSGLETSFFVMMVLVSTYLYLTDSRLWVVLCSVNTLVRPEGALIFGILLLHKLLFGKGQIKEVLICLGGFGLLLIPFAAFKVWYYGDILPNPFYAKTGLSFEYLGSGLKYFWQFLKHYGLWGVVYIVPVLFFRSLDSKGRMLFMLVYLYTLYVITVGGDVLKVHRFFLPILPVLYLLVTVFLRKLYVRMKGDSKVRIALVIISFSIPVVFFLVPHKWIRDVRDVEKSLVEGMQYRAEYLKAYFQTGFSISVTTIGSISYYLGTDSKVIDMLGLTDKYISRHPEEFEGITATWKERRYNTRYLLSLDPDFILFSTGLKPSAPAERALFLNSKFRENYSPIYVPFGRKRFAAIFRGKGRYSKTNEVFGDVRFVDLFVEALHLRQAGKGQEAIEKLKQVISIGPEDFALPHMLLGQYYYGAQDFSEAETYLKKAIELDKYSVMAHFCLARIYLSDGRLEEAKEEKRKVLLYNPAFPW